MDPITIGSIIIIIIGGKKLVEYFRNRSINRQINASELLAEHYKPEKVDIDMRTNCVDMLENQFPNPPELCMWERIQTIMSDLQLEERKNIVEELYKNVAEIMKLDPAPELSIEQIQYFGAYDIKKDKFYLSETLLKQDETCADMIQTIFHELKHAVQWRAIQEGGNVWGYSDELLAEWACNVRNYIAPEIDPIGYLMQSMELDTFGFENSVLQNPKTPIDFKFLAKNDECEQVRKS